MDDLIVELVYNEINPTRIMYKLKAAGLNSVTTDPGEKRRNATLQSYSKHYETCVKGFEDLAKKHTGRELRKQLHLWSQVLKNDGRRKRWTAYSAFNDHQDAYAMIHFSDAIIEAFRKLPKV